MSRWAALFRSLSTDTADTTDKTRPVPPAEPGPEPDNSGSVDCVRCVHDGSAGKAGGADPLPDTAPDPADAAERAAMAEHYAAPAAARPWQPGDPDPLAAGLFASWRGARAFRLAALSGRLHAARPKRTHSVRQLDWQAWEAAARAAACLPTGAWFAWRAAVGTGTAAP